MKRKILKEEAKQLLHQHFPFFVLLFLPIFLLNIIAFGLSFKLPKSAANFDLAAVSAYLKATSALWDNGATDESTISILLGLATDFILIGIMFVLIDLLRKKEDFTAPLQKSLTIFSRGDYFWGAILIELLMFIWTFLWALLLVIPGIIKSFAYSQSVYIYRDHLDQHDPIKYREAVTLSRRLMDGHKWEFFILQLSFIGWFIIAIITFGLAAIWVVPYYQLTTANFYKHLIEQ